MFFDGYLVSCQRGGRGEAAAVAVFCYGSTAFQLRVQVPREFLYIYNLQLVALAADFILHRVYIQNQFAQHDCATTRILGSFV
jgi:hypothetical protein